MVTLCFIPISVSRLIPIIEEQVNKEFGVDVHIERLILRVGPFIKLKAPIMHLLYEDGQKFAQLDNVKLYVPIKSLFSEKPTINTITARRLTVRVSSDDKYLLDLNKTLQSRGFKEIPNIKLKEYRITYLNKTENDKYNLEGQGLELSKIINYKSLKLKTIGSFSINNTKHLTYDLNIIPMLDIDNTKFNFDILDFIEHIKELDFYSDIIADIKLYNSPNKIIQASGFVNIDNISVLDVSRKNPRSFVYLTLWGDKASVLSNLYASSNKKIYIEGMVNNSQKPVVDLKVKTDEIQIKDLYSKLKILSNITKLTDIQDVEGFLNANFSLKGDLKKIKSSGYFKIKDAKLLASGVKIDKINSDIDFSNNTINIVNTVGYVNNSPIILKGKIDKNIDLEILMNKVDLRNLCPSKWGVSEGVISLIAKFSGTFNNPIHKENLSIDNLRIKNDSLDLLIESLKFDTNKSNTAYVNNVICKTKETEPLKLPSMKLQITPESIKIPETNIFMQNSKLTMKSEILNYNNSEINYVFSADGFINSRDLSRLKSDSSRYPLKFLANGNKSSHNVNLQVLLEKTDIFDEPAILNLTSKVDKNIIKIEDLSLNSFSGKLSDDLKSNLKGTKKITITGLIELGKEAIIKNVRIFIPQILNLNVHDTLMQIKGDLFLNGPLTKPEIIGQLNLQNLFNQALQLSLNNCSIDFNKNNAVINAPQVKINDTSLGLNALISTDITSELLIKNINIKSKYLNTDTVLMYKDSPILKILPVRILDGKFYSERVLADLYGTPVYLSAFTSDFQLNDNIIKLKNIASEIFNGKLAGNIDYNLRDEHFTSNIMARGVSAEPIFNIISARKDSISGNMDFDSTLKGELTSKQSLNGNIKFVINNGRMSTLGKLEHLLYAQNVIADHMLRTSLSVVTKAITLKDTGLFKYLRGDINLENGIAQIKMLQSQGPLMALLIRGDYNTLNDNARMVVLGRLSDEIVSGLGTFGDFSFNKLMIMLTGEDNNKYKIQTDDLINLPQLSVKNTKEFRSIINGPIDKTTSVLQFNWISYSEKSLKQREIPMTETKVPDFVESLAY